MAPESTKGRSFKPYIKKVPGLLKKMHEDHLAGLRLFELEAKYGYGRWNIRKAFEGAGLQLIKRGDGRFQKTLYFHSEAEIAAFVEKSTRFVVPRPLATEWREWPLEKRASLVRQMVAKHGWPNPRPEGPFSAGLEPFDYTSPRAHEVAAQMNAGLASRDWICHLKICSRGVIFEGKLYCWIQKYGYVRGGFTKGKGRECLHRLLYSRYHGPIPSDGIVRFRDGNQNNMDPANLYLETRNDLARQNQAAGLTRRSRAHTAALLKRVNQTSKGTAHELGKILG
ncbi:hypothetical protein GCM10023213_14370 [Prosthecobacter algae]|uniref:HNH nuclease domain-containing protein n=1 Tax=Prosthecobacter algae TaxID=1144682 RepID=A0ABP9P426_9BACT